LPAGLVDPGESASAAAVRELKEESGYTGVVTKESVVMYNGIFSLSKTTQNPPFPLALDCLR